MVVPARDLDEYLLDHLVLEFLGRSPGETQYDPALTG
jgi:hypothetical protein